MEGPGLRMWGTTEGTEPLIAAVFQHREVWLQLRLRPTPTHTPDVLDVTFPDINPKSLQVPTLKSSELQSRSKRFSHKWNHHRWRLRWCKQNKHKTPQHSQTLNCCYLLIYLFIHPLFLIYFFNCTAMFLCCHNFSLEVGIGGDTTPAGRTTDPCVKTNVKMIEHTQTHTRHVRNAYRVDPVRV